MVLSCSALEPVDVGVLRFDEFGAIHRKGLVKNFAELLGKNDRNCSRITRVNGNGKGTGIAIVTVNGAIGFPNAVSVTGGMIVVTNEENLGPEVLIERVLGFDRGEVVAGRDDASVQDDEIGFAGGKKNRLLRSTTERDASEENGGVVGNFGKRWESHGARAGL
jgi:hypothetical protein